LTFVEDEFLLFLEKRGMQGMFQPTLEEAKKISQGYPSIPVSCEMLSDMTTPIEVLQILKNVSRHCYLLESIEDSQNWGRYTFLGYDPKLELTCINGKLTIKGGTEITVQAKHSGEYIKQIIAENASPRIPGLPTFTGGLVGYFSYDYIKYAEPSLKLDAEDQENFQDVDLMLFDKVIVFDNLKQKIILIVNVKTNDLEENYNKALLELESMKQLIRKGGKAKNRPLTLKTPFRPLFDKEAYCKMVEKAKHYIYEGDIFQVVLSNRMEAEAEGSLLNTYRVMRMLNPSPYMFYFSSDDIEIAGASPETLVKLEDGVLHTFPLAGTRPRGKTPEEDRELEAGLLADPKELAEHNMLVDLGRNDLGKISKFGSVEVERYMSIERFSHVMHIGSTVRGEIREDRHPLDAVDAVLPAGTLSGAPKIRACEIINELENNKRGIYGGAIGYIDFTGNLDTCIAIRIAFKKNGKVFVRSGAGIVADSVPENEFQECINKAKAVICALEQGQEDLDQ
jgi:anthranilate synthase component 1